MKTIMKNTIKALFAVVLMTCFAACSDDNVSDLQLSCNCSIEALKLDDYEGKVDLASRTVTVNLPETYDTRVELFTRVKRILPQSGENWSESQKVRANMVFEFAPKLKEAYSLVCKLRAIFRNKKLTKETAKDKLHAWYKEVSANRLPEMTSAMKALKSKENEVLNYFVNRSTNAAAESLNSKMKGFRSELRGVRDLPFFLYRCTMIFG